MLKHRVITALVLVVPLLLGIFYLDTLVIGILFGIILLLGANEWTRLAGVDHPLAKAGYLATVAAGMAGAHFLLEDIHSPQLLFMPATLWWILVTLSLIRYRQERSRVAGPLEKSLFGLLVMVPAWAALVWLHGSGEEGPWLLLYVMSLTWVADIGAYFAGRRWGRVKLAPAISPGKTREGVYGALAGITLWSGLLIWLRPETGPALLVLLLCLFSCLISVVGDLFESLLKRQAGVKDSGRLLPGHGGVLDRIDSLTAVAPVFVSGLLLLGGGG